LPVFEPPPGVMWPEPGSGFEASPLSPAGAMQNEAAAFRRAGRSRVGRVALYGVLAAVVIGPVLTVVGILRAIL
jgi:hypothetical protein